MGAERKKQARLDLMSQGMMSSSCSPLSGSVGISTEHVSIVAKKLLCDIVEALARLAVKFSTYQQPGTLVSANYEDLKLKLSRCRWAWSNEPSQPQKLVNEYDKSIDQFAVERALAQRRSSEAFAYLKYVLALHDKPVSPFSFFLNVYIHTYDLFI